jgi:hypothetical protein
LAGEKSSRRWVDDFTPAPPDAVAALATNGGSALSFLGSVTGIVNPTSAAFLSSQVGWVVGEDATGACSDQSGPLCPWVIDATTDGGQTWATQMSYTP